MWQRSVTVRPAVLPGNTADNRHLPAYLMVISYAVVCSHISLVISVLTDHFVYCYLSLLFKNIFILFNIYLFTFGIKKICFFLFQYKFFFYFVFYLFLVSPLAQW